MGGRRERREKERSHPPEKIRMLKKEKNGRRGRKENEDSHNPPSKKRRLEIDSELIETEEKGEKGDGENIEERKKGRRQANIRTMLRDMADENEI